MSKKRITLIITSFITSSVLIIFAFLTKLEHWQQEYFYSLLVLGILALIIALFLLIKKSKA